MVLQLTNEVRKAPTELCYCFEHVAPKSSMKMEHLQKLHIVKSYGPTPTTLLHYLIAIIKCQVEDESLMSNFEMEVQENVFPIEGEEFGMLQATITSLRNGLAYLNKLLATSEILDTLTAVGDAPGTTVPYNTEMVDEMKKKRLHIQELKISSADAESRLREC